MSVLKKIVFALVWGSLCGMVLGIVDSIRIGLIYHKGVYHAQGFIKPYLIDCMSIFSIATCKMIFFGAIVSAFISVAIHLLPLPGLKNLKTYAGPFQNLPVYVFFLALIYLFSLLRCHPIPLWHTPLQAVLWGMVFFLGSFLLGFAVHVLVIHRFPSRKYFGYFFGILFIIFFVAVIALEVRFSGLLKSPVFGKKKEMAGQSPNIVLIVLDTVRSDHLSCYGYEAAVTPVMDRIAAEGILFENCVSTSIWTLPSHASIFTGLYPRCHKVSFDNFHLAKEFFTVAEILKSREYQTAGFVANPIISFGNNFTQGFDYYKAYGNNKITRTEFYLLGNILWRKSGLSKLLPQKKYRPHTRYQRAEDLIDDIEKWFHVEYRRDKPFFLFLNFMGAHFPYQSPASFKNTFSGLNDEAFFFTRRRESIDYFKGKYIVSHEEITELEGLYTASIAYIDYCLGELFSLLKARGFFDRLALIITSDHGEYFGQHAKFYHRLFHNFGIYNELLCVPLIIRYSPAIEKSKVEEAQVQNVNIFPTILHLAGIDSFDAGYRIQGRNLFDLAKDGGREYVLSTFTSPSEEDILNKRQIIRVLETYPGVTLKNWFKGYSAVQNQQYKFVKDSLGNEQLFDLLNDPTESRDAILAHSLKAIEMGDLLKKWDQRLGKEALEKITIDTDPETLKTLQELGYLR